MTSKELTKEELEYIVKEIKKLSEDDIETILFDIYEPSTYYPDEDYQSYELNVSKLNKYATILKIDPEKLKEFANPHNIWLYDDYRDQLL